ncbi:cwfJ-like family protein [Tasmannia lanceolata]|uniref:cwfJ-like family protein n=1 Tax=Tasmannia lanceolata TaxID=3420 RepID=UPI00406427CC
MLSGVKFIPRDQLNKVEQNLGSDSSVKEKNKSKSSKNNDRRKKKKYHFDSSDSEGTERIKKESKRKRKWYSSGASSSSSLSQSESDNVSDHDEKKHRKGKTTTRERRQRRKGKTHSESSSDAVSDRSKKRSNRRKERYLSEATSSASSESEDVSMQRKGGRKHESMKRKEIGHGKAIDGDDVRDFIPQDNKESARKDMGLDWMLKPLSKPDTKSAQINEPQEEPQVEEVKKPNPRELNPYFKDDGTGYPEGESQTTGGNHSVVGDGGASWRLKALKRAQEQAAREGRKLDEVVEERWGSLGQLAVSVASRSAAPSHAHLRAIKDRKRGLIEESETGAEDKINATEKVLGNNREYLRGVSLRHPEMRKPKVHDSLSWRTRKGQHMSVEDSQLISAAASSLNKYSNDGNFMREFNPHLNNDADGSTSSRPNFERNKHMEPDLVSSITNNPSEGCAVSKPVFSANQLAAKVLQLRMKGKHEEAEKLMKEVETTTVEQNTRAKALSQGSERSKIRFSGREVPSHQNKKEEDADMHLAGKIVQNKQYSISGRADDEYDYDDVPRRKKNRKKEGLSENKANEKNYIGNRLLTQQERCQFCFENPTRPRHLVVSIANFTYLMLPQWQPVVEGHCCILPMHHESSTRTVDNNVWEEIRNFKKCLLMMFAKQDKDVVFLETVMGLAHQRRHCLIECIPLPCEIANEGPLYFKKAIDEAEDEWSQHNAKKLIDTSVKGLRASIPKDFPYFHVEFGLNKGFVHVIDDETQFKSSLGLNVIRGMLRLPEEDMYRRRKQESMETQKQAVASFVREWGPFDWTKQLD